MSINCKNVSFGYNGHIIVRDLNFTVDTGNFLLLAGENGSGKSTLVKGLLKLLPAMEGTISFTGEFENTRTGYLSQQTVAKRDFPAGVMEIVLSGNLGEMGFRPFYTRTEKNKAKENLNLLGIADLKDRCFRELSGGQQRRVLLARSLCAADKLLMLDEPFAGLDPLISTELYQQLSKINRETGMTIIMVSHDYDAINYVSHVLHLQKRQLFFGSMKDYQNSELGRYFFGKMEAENV